MAAPPVHHLPASQRRPVVLSLLGAFWPGHDAAGPNQSYRALTQALGAEFEFKVVARDRPFGKSQPLATPGQWMRMGEDQGEILYLTPGRFGIRGLAAILRKTPYDLLIMNGFFDRDFTIPVLWLRRLGFVPRHPTLISPRGELAAGALNLKSPLKRIHLYLAKLTGLLTDVWLHATGPEELDNNRKSVDFARGHLTADNIGLRITPAAPKISSGKVLQLAFVGRITRVKNVHFALNILARTRTPIRFGIIGPISDAVYWAECQEIIAGLPAHIDAYHHGEVKHDQIPNVLANFDGLILPTLGENFGHAIYEALSCGLPVVISDRTPWRDLVAKEAGWDLSLENFDMWVEVIETLAGLSREERARLSRGAQSLAHTWSHGNEAKTATANMFKAVLASKS